MDINMGGQGPTRRDECEGLIGKPSNSMEGKRGQRARSPVDLTHTSPTASREIGGAGLVPGFSTHPDNVLAPSQASANQPDVPPQQKGRGRGRGARRGQGDATPLRTSARNKQTVPVDSGAGQDGNSYPVSTNRDFHEWQRRMSKERNTAANAKASAEALTIQIEEMESHIESLIAENGRLEKSLCDANKDKSRALETVKKLQSAGLDRLDEPDSLFASNDQIRDRFKEMKDQFDNWVENHVLEDSTTWQRLKPQVSKVFRKGRNITQEMVSFLARGDISLRVILSACLGRIAIQKLFASGFSWIEAGGEPEPSMSSRLLSIIKQIQETARKSKCLWNPL